MAVNAEWLQFARLTKFLVDFQLSKLGSIGHASTDASSDNYLHPYPFHHICQGIWLAVRLKAPLNIDLILIGARLEVKLSFISVMFEITLLVYLANGDKVVNG